MQQLNTALVTGGGSGIGRELCKLFNRDGYRLIIVSLLEDELAAVKAELLAERPDADILTLQQDLSLPDAGENLYADIKRRGITLDVLVNCAGFGLWGEHISIPYERVKSMLLLNMVTLTTLSTKFGADMKAASRGHILNVGSTTSFQPLPYLAAYAATKHYVVAFSEALAEEMIHHGVHVSCVCPGTTQTKFLSTAGIAPSQTFGSVGYWADKAAMAPAEVARIAYEGMRAGTRKPIPGFSNWLHFLGSRVLPNRSMAWAMHRLYLVKSES